MAYKGQINEVYFSPPQITTLATDSIQSERQRTSRKIGIPQLDDHFMMNKPSKFIGVLAGTSHGKSAFLMSIARYMAGELDAKEDEIGIYATWEDAVEKFGVNDFGAISGVPVSSVYKGTITENEMKRLLRAGKTRAATPLWMVGHSDQAKTFNPRLTVTDFMLVMEELLEKQKRNVKFIMVDYLQLIDLADSRERDTRLKYNDAIYALRDMAHGFNLTVFVASQIKRDVATRAWCQPQTNDAMETSGFEHTCDGMLSLWNVKRDWELGKVVQEAKQIGEVTIRTTRDLMLVQTLKQKDGEAPVLRALDFVPEYNRFVKYGDGDKLRREMAEKNV